MNMDQECSSSFFRAKKQIYSQGTDRKKQCADLFGKLTNKMMSSSIYRVPRKLMGANRKDAYVPGLVAIGPFHRMQDLQAMEEHKWRYTFAFMNRVADPVERFELCWEGVNDIGKTIRDMYPEEIECKNDELTEMMLIDGCFIIELLLRFSEGTADPDKKKDFGPIFQNSWMLAEIRRDLVLVENQVPFIVIKKLWEKSSINDHAEISFPIINILRFFFSNLNINKDDQESLKVDGGDYNNSGHLLDVIHRFYLRAPTTLKGAPDNKEVYRAGEAATKHSFFFLHKVLRRYQQLHHRNNARSSPLPISDKQEVQRRRLEKSATQLVENGIDFESIQGADNSAQVKFDSGKMQISSLCIDETTEPLLKNLIAFEQCSFGSHHQVTSFVELFRSLIRSKLDVELLKDKKIIIMYSGGGDAEDVLALFNGLLKGVTLKVKDSFFGNVCRDVNSYDKSYKRWGKMQFYKVKGKVIFKALVRDYFFSTWGTLATLSALAIVVFTALQTVYTILGYYHQG